MHNSFGRFFQISTWGESHGQGVGVVIDGVPPCLEITEEDIQRELDRRRPGQSHLVTPRKEGDACRILSGVFEGKTLGTPLAILVENHDQRSSAYNEMAHTYRPSHGDYTYEQKYGIRAWPGGGRASARETIGRVAAGAVAKKVLSSLYPELDILAWVESVGGVKSEVDEALVCRADIEANAVRCADISVLDKMEALILSARKEGDSVGGIVRGLVRGMPTGLGDPVFAKLEALLGAAMLSIPAAKGFSIGSGFEGTEMRGSEHNDAFIIDQQGRIATRSNHSGGVQAGISNGQPLRFSVAFKPTATIMKEQDTVNKQGEPVCLRGRGRHDPCVLPRAVPIVEAMTALVLCDAALCQRGQCG